MCAWCAAGMCIAGSPEWPAAMWPGPANAAVIHRTAEKSATAGVMPLAAADPVVAHWLGQESVLLEWFFGPHPTLFAAEWEPYAFEDPGSNAFTAGMIIFGRTLIDETKNTPFGLLKLSGLLAHETAHLFQIGTGINVLLVNTCGVVKLIELHADYLAGGYFAWRDKVRPGAPADLAEMLFKIGDFNVNSSDHHGNPPERFVAFTGGYTKAGELIEKLTSRGARDVQSFTKEEIAKLTEDLSAEGAIYVRKSCVNDAKKP
jgi:hypothetical protein